MPFSNLDAIIVNDTFVKRGDETASLLEAKARQVLVVKPNEYAELIDQFLAQRANVMTVFNIKAAENGGVKALKSAEQTYGVETRRIIYSCLSGSQVKAAFRKAGLIYEGFRYVRYNSNRPDASLEGLVGLFEPQVASSINRPSQSGIYSPQYI